MWYLCVIINYPSHIPVSVFFGKVRICVSDTYRIRYPYQFPCNIDQPYKCYKFSAYSPWIRKYLSHNIANWLHDTTCFNCATCHAWQQRSEGEVVARWYHMDIIQRCVNISQETCSCPPSSKDNHLLFSGPITNLKNLIILTSISQGSNSTKG